LINTLNFAVRDVPHLVDSRIFAIINDEILSGNASNAVREVYAGSYAVVSPEILDGLKDDPYRPVINAIARNSSALASTHEYLINKHKSSGIRISIAMVTENNDLLNKIYHGTKSAEIRCSVECNPAFVSK
jgi:23S rRNA U2552 (ribose-2'-O)-methylase RlmE/FtsJ